MVHCSIEPIEDADLQFEVNFGGLMYHVYVRKRPHLEKFLEVVSKQFEVLVFTASQQVYAEKLLNLIDPTRKLIKHRLYRDSCLDVCDNFLKDLNVRSSSSVEFENIFSLLEHELTSYHNKKLLEHRYSVEISVRPS